MNQVPEQISPKGVSMAKGGWFLEKKGKFYGPFSAEKIRNFKAAGKITEETQTATRKDGRDALPLSAVIDRLEEAADQPAGNSNVAPVKAAPAAPRGVLEDSDDPKEWLVVAANREFGPYSLAHLTDLTKAGKLKVSDKVRKKDGTVHHVVSEILPGLAVSSSDKRAEPRQKKETLTVKPAPAKKPRMVRAVLTVLLVGVLGFGIFYMRGDINIGKGELREKIKETYKEAPSLQKMRQHAEMPPFNTMVQNALEVGLNFPAVDIRTFHSQDLDNKASPLKYRVSARHWQQFFKTPIRRVLSYTTNGQIAYTYLIDDGGLAFAVVIEGPTFMRQKFGDFELEDFAVNTHTAEAIAERTVWGSEIAEGILARAFWKGNKKEKNLEFICIMNDPDSGNGG